MHSIKDRIYDFWVRGNEKVRYEYERYVMEHIEEHSGKRFSHWRLLFRLNVHYRILKKSTPVICFTENERQKEPPEKREKLNDVQQPEKKAGNGREPYLFGAESGLFELPDPYHFAKSLLAYDVLSFDIFDTLLFRPFAKPSDLFLLVQHELHYLNFANIRIEMEKKAKDIAFLKKGSREISISDIYELVERYTGIEKEKGIELEFSIEKDVCYANPYMLRVFDLLKSYGKRIILVSDMYFGSEQLKELLHKCGYEGYERIFVSCECNANKAKGDLFDIVKARMKISDDMTVCHIGDNYNFDILNARSRGFTAKHYKNVNEVGNKYRATYTGMSELTGSAYGGIINAHLHNGIKKYSAAYEYGYVYGGIYVLGYCNWIYQYMKLHGIDKALFISRDGAIYQKVFQMMFPDTDTEYFYWSRIACAKLAAEKDKYDFILRIIRHRKNDIKKISIRSLLEMLDLQEFTDLLKEYHLSEDDCVTENNSGVLENFFLDHWDAIIRCFQKNECFKTYFERMIGESKHVCIVDIGWQGSGILGIKWLIEEKWKLDCKADCLLGGSKALDFTSNLPDLMDGSLVPYLFSRAYNRDMFDFFAFSNKHTNTGHFELFTQAQCPTFSGMKPGENGNIKFEFGIPEVENYEKIEEIHSGIYEFCRMYFHIFQNHGYLLNVSGYDAIVPFRLITKNPQFIREQLGDMSFSRNICADFENPYLETIEEVMIKQQLV